MVRGLMLMVALLWLPCGVQAAEAPGTITVLEGDALIYRGGGRVQAAQGVRVAFGDIIETAPNTFMQVELADKSVLQLGAETRAMLGTGASAQKKVEARWLFVMNGWCKMAGPKAPVEGAQGIDIRTRWFDVAANPGVVVFQATPTEVTAFAERGDIRIAERQASGPPIAVTLKAGDFYHRKWPDRGALNPGGTSGFVGAMPKSFRDSLPLRIDKFRDEDVRPKDAPDFAYADVESWLKAETWIRKPLVQRWRPHAKDPAFRAALIANLSQHTEWDPILFPEKYIKKEVKRPPPVLPPPPPPPASHAVTQ